ncbi:DUF3500 domain-containing protein [Telmatocola sphagniphila]|uniref:DUF3500 domain-containing protein n=1 Tax=Telmatocola sphagniphila TaxID=1123043 RepID=A0A8E6ESA5_9BACT|nr:DUF3500 domain-containing protein [Telmatocola sphagniphila]QVL30424.1 DUF3500 domain-containing protein [Telmatocola sphagniphila]
MQEKLNCPECVDLDRRDFVRLMGTGAAVLSGAGLSLASEPEKLPMPQVIHPAEELVKELFAGLSEDQKKNIQLPWNHEARGRMYNKALGKPIKDVYTKPQQELVVRVLKAMSSGEEGYRQFSRDGTWDASKSFENCGANIFGDPTKDKYAFVFSGHHITLRCDGDSEEETAFGGPIYYGHTPMGYDSKNIFNYQTREVARLFEALDAKQRSKALITMGTPGEHEESVSFKEARKHTPAGLATAEMTADEIKLVDSVMRTILSPYRKEDVDEVMAIIKRTGGMEKIRFAFYTDESEGAKTNEKQPWSFWRLEGPGFIWNYRVLPHVHAYVNVSSKA